MQITILFVPLQSLLKGICDQREQIPFQKHIGELAEWSNAAVLKTVDLNGSGGSNPSLSAEHKKKSRQVYLNAIFLLCFATPRRRRGGMCERSEQILESEGCRLVAFESRCVRRADSRLYNRLYPGRCLCRGVRHIVLPQEDYQDIEQEVCFQSQGSIAV